MHVEVLDLTVACSFLIYLIKVSMPMASARRSRNRSVEVSDEHRVAVRRCWVKHFKFKKGSLEAHECRGQTLVRDPNFRRLLRKEGLFQLKGDELSKLIDQTFETFQKKNEVFMWPYSTDWVMVPKVMNERRQPLPSRPPITRRRRPVARQAQVFAIR